MRRAGTPVPWGGVVGVRDRPLCCFRALMLRIPSPPSFGAESVVMAAMNLPSELHPSRRAKLHVSIELCTSSTIVAETFVYGSRGNRPPRPLSVTLEKVRLINS
jgi:hypothetical protein